MEVVVSCAGRFHAFALVEQLEKRGALKQFITTLASSRIVKNREFHAEYWDSTAFRSKLMELPVAEYVGYGLRSLPIRHSQSLSYLAKDNLYDQRAKHYIDSGDLFVGWANQSLFQLREAKTRGIRTVIERGSTHIETQYALIDNERERCGLQKVGRSKYDQLLIDKQLKEYRETDYIMVPSSFARASFLDRGFAPERILQVPYGVDVSRFRSVVRRPTDVPTILFAGAIGFQKGVALLLSASKLLRERGCAHRLKLVGRMEEDFGKWLHGNALSSTIDELLSAIPQTQLVTEFQNADVFCLPSVQEGLALVIPEAMATGLSVVATHNSGAGQFIQDGVDGFVTAPDAEALADRLEVLLRDEQRRQSVGEAAALKASAYSWDTYGERIVATYKSILDAPVASPDDHDAGGFYEEYWKRSSGWTPSHSFTESQLDNHFGGAFRRDDNVLDVGCGDASNYQSWLVDEVGSLTAIDISQVGIANAKRMGIQGVVHDLSKRFPFSDGAFDGATCIEVLEHLYDPKFAVQEIFRVLRPGGTFIASVPNNGYFRERLKMLTRAELSTSITNFENEWKGAHIRFYSLDSFTRMLRVCGFEIESVRSNQDASIFDGFEAFGGYFTQHATTLLRKRLPRVLRLAFLENWFPSLFAPDIIIRARRP